MIALYIIAGIVTYIIIGIWTYFFILYSEKKGVNFEITNYEDAYWQCIALWWLVWFFVPYYYSKKYRKK